MRIMASSTAVTVSAVMGPAVLVTARVGVPWTGRHGLARLFLESNCLSWPSLWPVTAAVLMPLAVLQIFSAACAGVEAFTVWFFMSVAGKIHLAAGGRAPPDGCSTEVWLYCSVGPSARL